MDETVPPTTKNLVKDDRTNHQSSTSPDNLLKFDTNLWKTKNDNIEAMKNKSQSLINIAGNSTCQPLINLKN